MARKRHTKETRRTTLPLFPTLDAEERPPPVTYADLTGEPKVILEGEPDALVGHDELTDPRAVKIEVPPAPAPEIPPPAPAPEIPPPAPEPIPAPVNEPEPEPEPEPTRPPTPRALRHLPLALALLALLAAGLSRLGGPKPLTEPVLTDAETNARAIADTHRRQLSEYGWVDRDKRIIRMPIERAMQQIAADGKR